MKKLSGLIDMVIHFTIVLWINQARHKETKWN